MNPSPPPNEILVSLAQEIRQTLEWLGRQEEPPSSLELRSHIRTLREAATMAGMDSVEQVLDHLDADLDGGDRVVVDLDSKVAHALEHLASLIASMAISAQKQELEWVELVHEVECDLDEIMETADALSGRLSDAVGLVEAASMTPSTEERTDLLVRLVGNLRRETIRQNELRERVAVTSSNLRAASRKLTRELSDLHSLPLTPTLIRLREQTRQNGLHLDKPVSLHPRCSGTEVGVGQIEPLGRVLEFLVQYILREGMDKPKERRKSGKPSVGNIRIVGLRNSSLVELRLEDDGRKERPEPKLNSQTRKDLAHLKARLLRETSADSGHGLVLQIPAWYNTLEAVPARTHSGDVLVPLVAVAEVFTSTDQEQDQLPVVSLERRQADEPASSEGSGIVFQVNGWKGIMFAELLGGHYRVVPLPPDSEDPAWVVARVKHDGKSRPLVHPLPFMTVKEGQSCLFPR